MNLSSHFSIYASLGSDLHGPLEQSDIHLRFWTTIWYDRGNCPEVQNILQIRYMGTNPIQVQYVELLSHSIEYEPMLVSNLCNMRVTATSTSDNENAKSRKRKGESSAVANHDLHRERLHGVT